MMRSLYILVAILPLLSACSTSFDPNACRAPQLLSGYPTSFESPDIATNVVARQLRSPISALSTARGTAVGSVTFGQPYRFVHMVTGETVWSFDPDVLLRPSDVPGGTSCVCVNDSTFLLSCSVGSTTRYYFLSPATKSVREVMFAGISGRTWTRNRAGIVADPLIATPDGRQCMLFDAGTLLVDLSTGQIVDSAFHLSDPEKYILSSSTDGKRVLAWSYGSGEKDQLFIDDVRIDAVLSVSSKNAVVLRSDGMQLATISTMNVSTSEYERDAHLIIERWDCSDLGSIRRIASIDVTAVTCRYAYAMSVAITADGSIITTGYRAADLSGYDIITISAADNSVRVFR